MIGVAILILSAALVGAIAMAVRAILRHDITVRGHGKRIAYRVRHPAAPDMWVWFVEQSERKEGPLGEVVTMKIHMASPRGPMTLESARELAEQCGGFVEMTRF